MNLADLLKKGGADAPPEVSADPTPPSTPAESKLDPDLFKEAKSVINEAKAQFIEQRPPLNFMTRHLSSVELEAVVGGALMRLRFDGISNPAEILPALRELDPNAKVRDDFPSKNFGGKRDTKTARVLVINADVREAGKFISLTATGPDGDLTISVTKKNADEWLGKVAELKKLGADRLAKLHAAFEQKKSATIIVPEEEQFGALYWETEGKAFLDSMVPEPPALPEGGES